MSGTVFVAGATGAVGTPLVRALWQAGWQVHGSTRRPARAAALREAGVQPVVVDVLDAAALAAALAAIRPDAVVHQLTDLPAVPTPDAMAEALARNARLRRDGTRHLVAAMQAAGCHRLVAQSIAWAYAPGPLPHAEHDALDTAAGGDRGLTVGAVQALESLVLGTPGLHGTVLRYGRLYGPGTWRATPPPEMPVHVHDAAQAAVLALAPRVGGAFNVSEPCAELDTTRLKQVFGWMPGAAA